MSGTRANPVQLTLSEAIIKGTAVRDGLTQGISIIQDSLPLDSVEDYLSLYSKLYAAIPDLVDSMWVTKYFHMLFPELIPVFYNKDWQERVLTALKQQPNATIYQHYDSGNSKTEADAGIYGALVFSVPFRQS